MLFASFVPHIAEPSPPRPHKQRSFLISALKEYQLTTQPTYIEGTESNNSPPGERPMANDTDEDGANSETQGGAAGG
ncbi:hypothetical protein ACHAPT_003835 [Fusarium lateritium]